MDSLSVLQTAFDAGEPLVRVREEYLAPDSTLISAVELQFTSLAVVVSAVADDDTIAIVAGLPSAQTASGHSSVWDGCIGKRVRWAWLLKNQQGYLDGARFEFGNADEPGSVVVELIVAASGLEIFLCKSVDD